MIRTYRLALLSACALASLSASAYAASSEAFIGGSVARDSWYSYVGGVTALNHSLQKDGVVVRALAGYGEYSYDRPSLTSVDGRVTNGDIMVGYQKYFAATCPMFKGGRLTAYVGGDYQDQHLNKLDLNNKATGSEFGLKGQLEAKLDFTSKLTADLAGSYSGAFDTYWSRARVGYSVGSVTVGPEAVYLGNDSFDQQRYGAFIGDIHLTQMVSANVSAGYSNASRRGKDGGYVDLGLTLSF